MNLTATQRRILIWMCLFIAVNQFGFGALIPVLPLYAEAFGVPASAVGSTIAVYGLARMFSAPMAGRFADARGRRISMAMGGALCTLGNLWCGLASGFSEFVIARFIAGLGAGWVQSVGLIVLADISEPQQRGRMMALYQGSFLFAVGIGPFPGGWLAQEAGLAMPFLAYAGASMFAGFVAWFVVEETGVVNTLRHGQKNGALTDAMAFDAKADPPFLLQIRSLLSDRGFALICLVGMANAVVRTGGLFHIVPILAVTKLDLGPRDIGLYLAIGSVLGLVASYPTGQLADRFGRKPIIVPSALLTALAFGMFYWAPNALWFAVACATWGVAAAVNGAAPAAYAADHAKPGMNAAAMSSYRMMSDVGYVLGPIALGVLVDVAGTGIALLSAAGLIGSVGFVFALAAPESYRSRTHRND